MSVSVIPLDLRNYKLHYPDELSMDGMGCERQQIQRLSIKSISMKRCCSFNSLILYHLELLTSTEKLQNKLRFLTFKVTESACTK